MNILISNDDGCDSPGLQVLAQTLSKKHNVYVLAPDSNRSAVSHHITMFSDTEVKKINEKFYSCVGFPADCVAIGLSSDLFDVKFDCVISGINMGGNLGTDIVYSGTCGAARQAVLDNVPGIALSIEPISWDTIKETGFKFEGLANFVEKNLEELIKLCSLEAPRTFVNINACPLDSYKGVKISKELCVRNYNDDLRIVKKEGKTISEFHPGFSTKAFECSKDSDYSITHDGYINVSVVYTDPVCNSVDNVNLVI